MEGTIIATSIVLIVVGGIVAAITSFFRLQRHRADALAMASYRKLAEEAVAEQRALREELNGVRQRLSEVETLLRSVE